MSGGSLHGLLLWDVLAGRCVRGQWQWGDPKGARRVKGDQLSHAFDESAMYCGRELFQLSPIGEARQPMEPWQEQGR